MTEEQLRVHEEFGRFVDWLSEFSKQLKWNEPLDHWQNYCAMLGVALVRNAMSVQSLSKSGFFQGQAAVTRQTFELATRFVFCVRKREVAWYAALKKELEQVNRICKIQTERTSLVFNDASEWKSALEAVLKCAPEATKHENEPETGDGLSESSVLAYKWLCLGAHERPRSLLIQYGSAISPRGIDVANPLNPALDVWHLKLCAHALYEAVYEYIRSDLFTSDNKSETLRELAKPFRPLNLYIPVEQI
jgi:hypothetical protein